MVSGVVTGEAGSSSISPREVYPGSPLALVAAEVRWPATPEVIGGRRPAFLRAALRSRLPLAQPVVEHDVTLDVMAPEVLQRTSAPRLRFTTRDRSTAIDISAKNVVVETTQYRHYEEFRALLELALRALTDDEGPDGLERIGLRYIDEVRVPVTGNEPTDWRPWIHGDLLRVPGPTSDLPRLSLVAWQGAVQMLHDGTDHVVFRYGPGSGHAVDPNGPTIRPRAPSPGPFFLLDFDSFYLPGPDVPEFRVEDVLGRCDRLHGPVRSIFEASITERLRNDVLRK